MYALESNRRPYVISEAEQRHYERVRVNEEYEKFRKSLKVFLVSESINYILQKNLQDKSQFNKELGEKLCTAFVTECGADNLLRRFRKESCLLAEMANIVTETFDDVICKLDKDNSLTFHIKPSDKKSFYDGLDGLSIDSIVKKVNQRACDAAADFIQANVNDKLDIEDIAEKTQEKIDKITAVPKEKKDAMVKEYATYARNESYKVRHRCRSVYEQMVVSISNQTMKNSKKNAALTEAFVGDNGAIKMDSIVETADTMYKFLETINTARIQPVNSEYISELLNGIK